MHRCCQSRYSPTATQTSPWPSPPLLKVPRHVTQTPAFSQSDRECLSIHPRCPLALFLSHGHGRGCYRQIMQWVTLCAARLQVMYCTSTTLQYCACQSISSVCPVSGRGSGKQAFSSLCSSLQIQVGTCKRTPPASVFWSHTMQRLAKLLPVIP